jgi:two-component system response regulator CpxR
MNKILLADDDVELTEMLVEYLTIEGFSVDTTHDGKSALKKAERDHYDLIILDVMMPELNGFDVLRQLRNHSQVPVLMLTARGEDVDSIVGLEIGADDYLAKPCNPRVLVAHIRAILRRTESVTDSALSSMDLRLDDLEVQRGKRLVLINAQPITMTSTEYSVLLVLLENAGHVVSKQTLSQLALGRELSSYDRSLDMHVSNLRKKLGTTTDGQERITTVRGIGYQYLRLSHE